MIMGRKHVTSFMATRVSTVHIVKSCGGWEYDAHVCEVGKWGELVGVGSEQQIGEESDPSARFSRAEDLVAWFTRMAKTNTRPGPCEYIAIRAATRESKGKLLHLMQELFQEYKFILLDYESNKRLCHRVEFWCSVKSIRFN